MTDEDLMDALEFLLPGAGDIQWERVESRQEQMVHDLIRAQCSHRGNAPTDYGIVALTRSVTWATKGGVYHVWAGKCICGKGWYAVRPATREDFVTPWQLRDGDRPPGYPQNATRAPASQ